MKKNIPVPFYIATQHRTCVVNVAYSIEISEDTLFINCSVNISDDQRFDWLQIDEFDLKARLVNGEYKKLENSGNRVKSVDGILFIDNVYEMIMRREKDTLQIITHQV